MRKSLLPVVLFVLAACRPVMVTTSPNVTPPPAPAAVTTSAAPGGVAAAAAAADNCNLPYASIGATLWMQTSAEYSAITREVYETADRTLDAAIADPTWTAAAEQKSTDASMKPAIILDLDETVLDTSGHQALEVQTNTPYTEEGWHDWAAHDQSLVIEAAKDFLLDAQKKGVQIFYVTNRDADLEQPLRASLTRLGVPLSQDNLLMRGQRPEWKSDKSSRRAFIAQKYRIIMLFGDDLNDFAYATGKSRQDRDAIVAAHSGDWGRKWFILPNPVYGSWERAASGGKTPCEQMKNKIDALRR